MKTTKQALSDVLEQHRGERHVIVLHNCPDPDALASGFAHRLISAEFDIECTLLYDGPVSQYQNQALIKLLGADLLPYTPQIDFSRFQGAVLVDHQGKDTPHIMASLQAADVPVLVLVDHHEPAEPVQAQLREIHPTGATATIYAQFLEQGLANPKKNRKEYNATATALLFAILTGTSKFVFATPEDFEAAAYLGQYRDADFLEHVMNQARSKHVMELIRRALGYRLLAESFSIAGIGYLRSEDRDAISQAADFLMTEENVHTAIVYGIVKDGDQNELLVGAIRTSKITLYPDEFAREVFGDDTVLNSSGHNVASSEFVVPIGFLAGAGDQTEDFQDLKWKVYDSQVKYKILNHIGAKQEYLDSVLEVPSNERSA